VTNERTRILIIDDEAPAAHAIARVLSSEGETFVETLPMAALKRIEAGERFDVILCDIMMPEMTGMDVYAAVARISRDEADRIVFMTGGVLTLRAREFLKEVPNRFLDKPFDVQQLLNVIHERAAVPIVQAEARPSSHSPASPRR
jgi:CheY-like chemotaxis protein